MSKRKTAVGLAVLFALALSAFAASSASAKGVTAYTCVKDANGDRFGAHCLTTGTEKYKHVEIKQDETTTGTATNANTATGTTAAAPGILKGTLSGVLAEVECKEVHGEGTFENRKNASGEMYAHAEGKLHYTGCVMKAPKKCKVKGETIETVQLTGTTEGQQTHEPKLNIHTAKITPKEGIKFADIVVEGCENEGLNQTYPVTGSVNAKISGATLTATHTDTTSAPSSLKFGGQKAGLEGALTLKAHSKAGEETNPLTVTTEP